MIHIGDKIISTLAIVLIDLRANIDGQADCVLIVIRDYGRLEYMGEEAEEVRKNLLEKLTYFEIL